MLRAPLLKSHQVARRRYRKVTSGKQQVSSKQAAGKQQPAFAPLKE